MLKKIEAAINRFQMLHAGDLVVIGVSGGPDSVALGHVLTRLQKKYHLRLHVAHLDHMFRGQESREDARFVARLATAWGVPVTVASRNVPVLVAETGMSPQDAARQVRYQFLQEVADGLGAQKIAVGHHADDQAETVLLHLLRGSGPEGLAGMAPCHGRLIRPLLGITRTEIEAYCCRHQLVTRSDPSNRKPVYLRNRVRLELLPLLRDYNPQVTSALLRTANLLRDENDFLEQELDRLWPALTDNSCPGGVTVDVGQFVSLHPALQRRVVRRAFLSVQGSSAGLGWQHVDRVCTLGSKGTTGKMVELPHGVRVTKKYGQLIFQRGVCENGVVAFYYRLQIPGETRLPVLGKVMAADLVAPPVLPFKAKKNEAWLDYHKLAFPLCIRQRQPGDRFWPLGAAGPKKLKEYFINAKIPVAQRDLIPLVACAHEVVWVAGWRIDERLKITADTKQALHLSLYRG
jgi:tRNA(Ile)-lysidine synthase